MIIGNYVRIETSIEIYDMNFHSLKPYDRMEETEKGDKKIKIVIISNYTLIGINSRIRK